MACRSLWSHYKKDYNKYYLKDHKEYKEPLFVFSPSIGISDIEFYNSDYLERWKGDMLVASMKIIQAC